MPNFPPIIIYAIPFFVFAMLLEFFVASAKNIKSYTAKDAFSSIAMGLGNVFIGLVSKLFVFAALYYVYENLRIFTIPITWWSFIILFFYMIFRIIGFIELPMKIDFFGRLMSFIILPNTIT